ncbi:serine O-acetyltransferase [Ligilactobacillus salivarius]|uniref:serine O-acetyltransferase n=1 Tax=Ligilactobacillus salivarius TaxID=1624 RepID=UPI003F1ED340
MTFKEKKVIRSKSDLKEYMYRDKIALHYAEGVKRPGFKDDIWKFEILLRKNEYVTNCLKSNIFLPYKLYIKYRFHKMSLKLGFTIPLNSIDSGLSIAHYGLLTIGNCKIGKNCRIQEGVNIGSTSGDSKAATIGDNVFIGTGAKIIGNIKIADNVVIGAGSVVTKSILEEGVTYAGVPARKISNNDSKKFIDSRLID